MLLCEKTQYTMKKSITYGELMYKPTLLNIQDSQKMNSNN